MNELRKQNINSIILIILATFIIFRPTPTRILGTSLGLKLADLLLFSLVLIVFVRDHKLISPKSKSLIFLVSLLFIEIFALGRSMFIHTILLEDIFELFRPILYVALYLAVYKITNYEILSIRQLKKAMNVFAFLIITSYVQLFNLFNIKYFMSFIYEVSKSRTMDINVSIWRVSGTFTNPNYFGFFLTFVACFMLVLGLIGKKKLKFLMYFFIISILVLFTGSRTAVICELLSAFIILVIYFRSLSKSKKVTRLIKTSFLTLLILFVIMYFVSPLIFEKFGRFSNIYNIKLNFIARYEAWQSALDIWIINPILGNGPYKAYMDSFDNNYVLILYRNGLVGLLSFMAFFANNITKSFKIYKRVDIKGISIYGIAMVGVNISLLVSMLTAVTYNFIQTGSIYILLVAIQDKFYDMEVKKLDRLKS